MLDRKILKKRQKTFRNPGAWVLPAWIWHLSSRTKYIGNEISPILLDWFQNGLLMPIRRSLYYEWSTECPGVQTFPPLHEAYNGSAELQSWQLREHKDCSLINLPAQVGRQQAEPWLWGSTPWADAVVCVLPLLQEAPQKQCNKPSPVQGSNGPILS